MDRQNRKQELRRRAVLAAALLAALAAAALALFHYMPSRKHMTAADYYGFSGSRDLAVIVDDTISEEPGVLIDGLPYLPYSIVAEKINPALYYDEPASLLIRTTPTEMETLDLGSGSTENREAVLQEGKLYLALSYVESVTAMEAHYYESPGREVIRTNGTLLAASFSKNAAVRYRAGIKSPIIRDMKKGDRAYVLDTDADGRTSGSKVKGWTYVMTYNGYRGYVDENALGEAAAETLNLENPGGEYTTADTGISGKINMVFHQTTSRSSNRTMLGALKKAEGVNVVAPTWFSLDDTEGGLTDIASRAYVAKAHRLGVRVWAVLNDFDGGISSADETAAVLASFEARSAVIDRVVERVTKAGADGINVDFELVRESSSAAFSEFIRELSIRCREKGLVLSIDAYVPTYTKYLDRKEYAAVADFVVAMCYDEHTAGSEEAGSVASLPFVKKGIEDTLAYVPKAKLIAAIPFYTRVWTTEDGNTPSGKAYGMDAAASYVEENGLTKTWDEEDGQYYAEKTEGGTKTQVWLEDISSVKKKMEAIQEADCAGVAEWKLGLESRDVWAVIQSFI